MKQRDKLYKEATKEKDSQRKIKKHETSKNYWNKVEDLLKVRKQTNYKEYLPENKKTLNLFGMAFMKLYIQGKERYLFLISTTYR